MTMVDDKLVDDQLVNPVVIFRDAMAMGDVTSRQLGRVLGAPPWQPAIKSCPGGNRPAL